MPTLSSALPHHVLQTTTLKYGFLLADGFSAQSRNDEGVVTMLGSQSCDSQGLPTVEGILHRQTCNMTAAQLTCQEAKCSTYQPMGKPWLVEECSETLQSCERIAGSINLHGKEVSEFLFLGCHLSREAALHRARICRSD